MAQANYIRPTKTLTDDMQSLEEVRKKLENYREVRPEEIDNLVYGTYLRYITINEETKKPLFRTGGVLKRIHPNYLTLRGIHKIEFSVQRYHYDDNNNKIFETRFFKKISETDILRKKVEEYQKKEEEYKNIIAKKDQKITKLKEFIHKLKNKLHP